MYKINKGMPDLGCHLKGNGANFGLFASNVQKVLLNIYKDVEDSKVIISIELDRDKESEGDFFYIFIEEIKEGMGYEWRVWQEESWSKPLIDPYAYSLREYPEGSNQFRNIVVQVEPYKGKRPDIPWEDTILYELHVGAFTKQIKDYKGTFKGLVEKLPYLKDLGITTLELLPVFKWNEYTLEQKNPLTGERMKDIWGYNPIAFFALQNKYSFAQHIAGEIEEFKELVKSIHELGMEIILDVVYNHTGEGGEGGDIFNFKVLGNEIYYKIEDGKYMNCSGTGNTLDTSNDLVKSLILESLRYWVVYMGVDGFRFDLASILGQSRAGEWMDESILKEMSYDPILSNVKLIAESWDAKGCYDVGKMPYLFREWSDCFRDTIRRFIKGDIGIIEQVALCIAGKEIQFEDTRKTELNAIHFITAHDGFTLWDLVAYNLKHNELNGEDNRDGNDANYSDNCGIEGETDDEEVLKLRKRRVKNYFMLLLLSKGVPMILMGDEMGRTQRGNNNAYCQENEILWVDWHKQDKFEEIRYFVRSLIKIRKEITLARRDKTEESWHGVKYSQPDWSYHSRSLAYCIIAKAKVYYVAMNNYIEALNFELPPRKEGWTKRIDTYNEIQEEKVIGPTYQVKPYSICLFESKNGIRH